MNNSEELLKEILTHLKKLSSDGNQLWDINQVANYFDMKRSTVSAKIIAAPDFPKSISSMGTHPRWIPDEVKKWAYRHRG